MYDKGQSEISHSLQLVAGRTAQEYNRRKDKKGAYWEERYHATAVETGKHLSRCCSYIDFNMIRAGAIAHPSQWNECGYNEIITGRERYRIIDRDMLSHVLGYDNSERLGIEYTLHTEEQISNKSVNKRDPVWTESIATGSKEFVEYITSNITHVRASWKNRIHTMEDGTAILLDKGGAYNHKNSYNVVFGDKIDTLSHQKHDLNHLKH